MGSGKPSRWLVAGRPMAEIGKAGDAATASLLDGRRE